MSNSGLVLGSSLEGEERQEAETVSSMIRPGHVIVDSVDLDARNAAVDRQETETETGDSSDVSLRPEVTPTSIESASVKPEADVSENIGMSQLLEEAKVKFEPGLKCTDVIQAVAILTTKYNLSDVTIRKKMISWSSWNICDMVRGPHRESTWWKQGRSLPRKLESGEEYNKDNQISEDEVFDKEMEELRSKIDGKEKEIVATLGRILDEQRHLILEDAADPTSISSRGLLTSKENQSGIAVNVPETEKSGPKNLGGEGKGRSEMADDRSSDERENAFVRMFRSIRRRFSRQNNNKKKTSKSNLEKD